MLVCGCWLSGTALVFTPITTLTIEILAGFLLLSVLSLSLMFHRVMIGLILGVTAFVAANLYTQYFLIGRIPSLPYGETVQLRLLVFDRPTKFDDRARYIGISDEGWALYLNLGRLTEIKAGTQLTVVGKVRALAPDDPYRQLGLAKNNIFGQIYDPEIVESRPADISVWQRFLLLARTRFELAILRLFPDPTAALFAGIVAGLKTSLPSQILDNFTVTGLSHLIAVSGYNVTIMMGLFSQLSRRLHRWLDLLVSVGVITFFVIFTGATASVTRAGILAGCFVFARTIGRKASVYRVLIIAATIMTILNPLVIVYDIGFQLSFLAVVGLAAFSQPFHWLYKKLLLPDLIADGMAATSAAQLTTFPILAYHFQMISLYALLANLLVEPIVPVLTAIGIPVIILGCFLPPYFELFGLVIEPMVRYVLLIVDIFRQLPYAQVALPALPMTLWAGYFIVILIVSLVIHRIRPPS